MKQANITKVTRQVATPHSVALGQIRILHKEIESAWRINLPKGIRIGQLLTKIKSELEHGQWTDWVQRNLPFALRTAQVYMRFFENKDQLKNAQFAHLVDAERFLTEPSKQLKSAESALLTDAELKEKWASIKESHDKVLVNLRGLLTMVIEIKARFAEFTEIDRKEWIAKLPEFSAILSLIDPFDGEPEPEEDELAGLVGQIRDALQFQEAA